MQKAFRLELLEAAINGWEMPVTVHELDSPWDADMTRRINIETFRHDRDRDECEQTSPFYGTKYSKECFFDRSPISLPPFSNSTSPFMIGHPKPLSSYTAYYSFYSLDSKYYNC